MKKREDENKRAYGRDIEQGVFTPSSSQPQVDWGKRPEKTSRHARLEIRKKLVISWLRCKLSFTAVQSSIMYIRGTRSSKLIMDPYM